MPRRMGAHDILVKIFALDEPAGLEARPEKLPGKDGYDAVVLIIHSEPINRITVTRNSADDCEP